jgi:hypothetical protein
MERSTFELGKVFKENEHKSGHILGCFFSGTLDISVQDSAKKMITTYNGFSVLCIGKLNAYGLIDKEDICIVSPTFRMERSAIGIRNPARPFAPLNNCCRLEGFKNSPSSMNRPRDDEQPGPVTQIRAVCYTCSSWFTSVGPEYDIVGVWIIPALKEIEEYVAGLNINVARVRSGIHE